MRLPIIGRLIVAAERNNMNTSEAKAFLTNFHETRKLNDPEAVAPLFVEGASFSIAGEPREDSIAAEVAGADDFRNILEQLLRDWKWIDVVFKTVLTDGDLIVSRYHLTVEHVPSGKTVKTDVVDFMQMRDGKIANMRQFVDTAHLSAVALGPN